MKKPKNHMTLEETMLALQEKAKKGSISISEILQILSGKGRSLIFILLSLPFCQPIQIPGLSTPFGLVIAFMGLRMVFGKNMWFPERILTKKITSKVLKKLTDNVLRFIGKMRRWIHPRLDWLCQHSFTQTVNGLIIFILGIFLALPLPIPLSNLIAAWSIFLIALGLLEDDGVLILIGYAIFFLTILFFTLT